MVRDPQTGKYRRTRLFVLTLGCSRKSVRLLVFRSSSRIWAELHEKAFRRLGGVPASWCSIICAKAYLSPDIYDPTLNPLYRDVLAHYGVSLCRAGFKDPDRKGKVESRRRTRQENTAQGQTLREPGRSASLSGSLGSNAGPIRASMAPPNAKWPAMFAEEKPFLLPLPLEPFRYYQHGKRVVHLDGCVEVEAAYYGLPPGWIGRAVKVQWDELLRAHPRSPNGQLLREHVRQKRGWYRIKDEDHPQTHAASGLPVIVASRPTPVLTSARFATLFIASSENRLSVAFWACSRWPRSSVPQ